MTIRIKNWRKFQHYTKRNPPWIRLYRNLIDDRDWHELDGDAAKMLANLWLLASENDGELPPIRAVAFRLRISEPEAENLLFRLSHWLEHDDSTVIAPCLHDATPETDQIRSDQTQIRDETTETNEQPYVFESGVIRLTREDFEKWRDAFQHLDLKAELLALTQWAAQFGHKWFFPVSGALAKRNREQKAKLAQAPATGGFRHSQNDPLAGII